MQIWRLRPSSERVSLVLQEIRQQVPDFAHPAQAGKQSERATAKQSRQFGQYFGRLHDQVPGAIHRRHSHMSVVRERALDRHVLDARFTVTLQFELTHGRERIVIDKQARGYATERS